MATTSLKSAEDDKGRLEELKRQYWLTIVARDTAAKKSKDKKPRRSVDWIAHSNKKIKVLSQQLEDNNITNLDPYQFMTEFADG